MTKRGSVKTILCSKLAIATVMLAGATPAGAQSFIGGHSATGANVDQSVLGVTTINVTSPQAVINWSATGPSVAGLVAFQEAGTTATFVGTANFAVLNRVTPAAGNAISMNGTINSLVNNQAGGTVFFYSPTGIVIGSNATINVGSLGLTTSPIVSDGAGNWISGFGTSAPQVVFGSAAAGSYVRTDSGARLDSTGAGNYVALVAPRVTHSGVISTDGAAALVGAAAATITFRTNSLFDIEVTQGTTDANGVSVQGGTITRKSATLGGDHKAYLVAVPANTAMTMLVGNGASLGFDIAGSAGVEGNIVVLSTGHDVSGGVVAGVSAAMAGTDGDILLANSSFTSKVAATAFDYFRVGATAGTTLFTDDLTVRTRTGQIDAVGASTELQINGNLSIDASHVATAAGAAALSGGYNILAVGGGTITVEGTASIDASARGGDSSVVGVASGAATGGTIFVQAQANSILNFNNGLDVIANAESGSTGALGVDSGQARGGNININATGGNSSLYIAGDLYLQANGLGGGGLPECGNCSGIGGNGIGGNVSISTFGGLNSDITVGGATWLSADGTGSSGTSGASGSGRGGSASVNAGTTGLIDFQGAVTASANGYGGNHDAGGAGGSGVGGSTFLRTGTGSITVGGPVLLSSNGDGGFSSQSGGVGGSGTGGSASLIAFNGMLDLVGTTTLVAEASGGDGATAGGSALGGSATIQASPGGIANFQGDATLHAFAYGGSGAAGGAATGGNATILANGGTLSLAGNADAFANAYGGASSNEASPGADATGGRVRIAATSGGDIAIAGSIYGEADGTGGSQDSTSGVSGDGIGGQITITASGAGSTVGAGFTELYAGGYGGSNGECFECTVSGGTGTGGNILIEALGGTGVDTSLTFAGLYTIATGYGGAGAGGDGGDAYGGTNSLTAANGAAITLNGSLYINFADAVGGDAYGTGSAGNAFGGTAAVTLASTGGRIIFNGSPNYVTGDAVGGVASGSGAGGNATDGNASVLINGGTLTVTSGDLYVKTDAIAGASTGGGAGGSADAGTARVNVTNGNLSVGGRLFSIATARGGLGDDGGSAIGGAASILASPGGTINVTGSTNLYGFATGGAGTDVSTGVGGSATGGSATLAANGGTLTLAGITGLVGPTGGAAVAGGNAQGGSFLMRSYNGGRITGNAVSVIARATGGAGGTGGGGDGIGGTSTVEASTGGTLTLASLSAITDGRGGHSVGGSGGYARGGKSLLYSFSNAAISIGALNLSARSVGGNGVDGGDAGGSISYGTIPNSPNEVLLLASGGSVTITGPTTLVATAQGGAGANGGSGGDASGGLGTVSAFDNVSGASSVSVNQVTIDVAGTGGAGGAGINANIGLDGGAGGDATGGGAFITAAAGNSHLAAGDVVLNATATGGAGGTGGSGDGGAGGSGGMGGDAINSAGVIFGSISGINGVGVVVLPSFSAGDAAFGAISANLGATGGDGGNGGSGGGGAGAGGDGGNAVASDATLLVRGSPVTVGDVVMLGNASGGDGGLNGNGAPSGNGGDALTGGGTVLVTNRFNNPAQRGALTAGAITITGTAIGGTGVSAGASLQYGGVGLNLINGDATIESIDISVTANGVDEFADGSGLSIHNGTATVAGSFAIDTPGDVVVEVVAGLLSASSLTVDAGNFVHNNSIPAAASFGTIDADSITLTSGQDIIVDANLVTRSHLALNVPGLIAVGHLAASGGEVGSNIALDAGGTITTGNVSADGQVDVDAVGDILLGNVVGYPVLIDSSGGSVTAGTLSSTNFHVDVGAFGSIDAGNIAGGYVDLSAGEDIDTGSIIAAVQGATINAGDDLTAGSISAVGDVDIFAGGDMVTGALTSSGGAVYATAIGNSSLGAVTAFEDVELFADGTLGAGNVAAGGTVAAQSIGNLTLGSVNADSMILGSSAGSVTTAALTATLAGININAFNNITTGNVSSAGYFSGFAGGDITTGILVGGDAIELEAGDDVTLGTVTVADDIDIDAGDTLAATNITAGGGIYLSAGGALSAGNLSAGLINRSTEVGAEFDIGVVSGTSVALGNVAAFDWIGIGSVGSLTAGTISAGNDVLLAAGGNIQTNAITTGSGSRLAIAGIEAVEVGGGVGEDDEFDRSLVFAAIDNGLLAPTGGSVTISGAVNAGRVDMLAGTDIATGNLIIGGQANLAAGDDIAIGTIAASSIHLEAIGDIALGDATASHGIDIAAGGILAGANMTAGGNIGISAVGALSAGNLSAGLVSPSTDEGAEFDIGVLSDTSITLGNVAARGFVGIGSQGSLTAGSIVAGGDVVLAADGNVQTNAITAGSDDRLVVAGYDMIDFAGGPDGHFDLSLLFAALDDDAGIATGGSVTIGGAVIAGEIDVLAGGDFTSAAINAGVIVAHAGGSAILNGMWQAGEATVASNDISIGSGGGIVADEIFLFSTNATQTLIGNGLTGDGYRLDAAEFSRLSAPLVHVAGTSASSAAIDTLIGDLALTGGDGVRLYDFMTLNPEQTAAAGSLRIVGDVIGTNFGAQNRLDFEAGRVEVDAVNATISLTGAGGVLGGVVNFISQRVHVAEVGILDQLAVNPNYAGRNAALATAPAIARPDGVVRAGEVLVSLTGATPEVPIPYSLFVQNVGTAAIPVGFVANHVEAITPAGTAPGSIDMVVNGQIVTSAGTLTGVAVRDALITENDPARFTATSTINGCALTGACVIAPRPAEPTPALASQITLINSSPVIEQEFGNEEAIEDNEEEGGEDSASSPISPPAPLFNTRPLEQSGETDEPISGGGNPALTGNGPDEDDVDEEDE